DGRDPCWCACAHARGRGASEGFLALVPAGAGVGVGGRRGGGAGWRPPPAVAGSAARSPPVVLANLGGGPAEAGTDLVGHHLDLRALVALLGLPRALLEAARDDHPRALLEGFAGVLGHLPPADDVEERHRLAALVRLPVGPHPVDGEAETGRGLPARGEPHLRVAGDGPQEG